MAVNPLYRNEYYFFSGMYDDSLITDFYRMISSESFERSIHYQQNMLGRKRHLSNNDIFYKAKISDFKVDNAYNRKNNLADGSRSIKFPTMIIPVYNMHKFIRKYGSRNQKIPLIDFYRQGDIFDKSITLQIGNYRIMDAYLIQNDDESVSLAIDNSNTTGIPAVNFNNLIAEFPSNEPVWIFSDEITSIYYIDTTASQSISATATNGVYEVTLPISAALNNIGVSNHKCSNSWDCLISYKYKKFGKKMFVSSPCTLKTITSTNAIFYVKEEFMNYIKADSSIFNIYFINRPNRHHIFIYQYNFH